MVELNQSTLIKDASLVHYWRMEGNSTDSKGASNGTDTAITYAPANGIFGQGALFNGSTSKIVIADVTDLSIVNTNKLAFSFWVNPSSLVATNGLFSKTASSNNEYECSIGTDGSLNFIVYSLAGFQRYNTTTPAGTIVANKWQKILITVDDSVAWANTNALIYVNSVLPNNSYAGSSSNTLGNGTAGLAIGNDTVNTSFMTGSIDDFAVLSRIITAREEANFYNSYGGVLNNYQHMKADDGISVTEKIR